MNHNKRAKKLNRNTAHRKALLANMASSLIIHEQIKTTLPKAKFLRPYVEKLITLAKIDSLHNRRLAISMIKNHDAVAKLFQLSAERFQARPGGYTRILKAGFRFGDMAPVAVMQLLDAKLACCDADHDHKHNHG